jgi:anti-sigma regulatory factor (Ser/Thr protein kinase)
VDEVVLSLPAQPDSPAAARALIRQTLDTWGIQGPPVDTALVVASELTTNAVLHARSEFAVSLRRVHGRVRIEVRDESPQRPTPRQPMPEAISGRGLLLVTALSDSWGVDTHDHGKTTWSELCVD